MKAVRIIMLVLGIILVILQFVGVFGAAINGQTSFNYTVSTLEQYVFSVGFCVGFFLPSMIGMVFIAMSIELGGEKR